MQASHQDKLTLQVHHYFIQPACFDLEFIKGTVGGKGKEKQDLIPSPLFVE